MCLPLLPGSWLLIFHHARVCMHCIHCQLDESPPNFTRAWNDGQLLYRLVQRSLPPGSPALPTTHSPAPALEIIETALTTAGESLCCTACSSCTDQVLQVPRLVDAADVADPQRDTPALLTYVALLRRQALLVQRQRMVKFERGLSVCLCGCVEEKVKTESLCRLPLALSHSHSDDRHLSAARLGLSAARRRPPRPPAWTALLMASLPSAARRARPVTTYCTYGRLCDLSCPYPLQVD